MGYIKCSKSFEEVLWGVKAMINKNYTNTTLHIQSKL